MYYNILTKETRKELPDSIVFPNGGGVKNPSIKEASLVGWREMPKGEIKATPGSVVVDVAFVQDKSNPLKVEAIVTEKTEAAIAEEASIREQAAQTAKAEYEAARQKARDEITKPFADKEQAEAIGKLFDAIRWFPQ